MESLPSLHQIIRLTVNSEIDTRRMNGNCLNIYWPFAHQLRDVMKGIRSYIIYRDHGALRLVACMNTPLVFLPSATRHQHVQLPNYNCTECMYWTWFTYQVAEFVPGYRRGPVRHIENHVRGMY